MPARRPLRVGDYLMVDDESGRTYYRSEMVRRWDGAWVHWTQDEPRHPQEFVKALRDPAALRDTRPADLVKVPVNQAPNFVGVTTVPAPRGPAWHLFKPTGVGYWRIERDFIVQ